jgi:hypothetical protein
LAPSPALGLDDALDAIDQMLMLLMAAVDVIARVGYRVLGIGGPVSGGTWQDKELPPHAAAHLVAELDQRLWKRVGDQRYGSHRLNLITSTQLCS